jgi:aminopeptidase-like protein
MIDLVPPPDFIGLTRDLCKFVSGIVADENEALFQRLGHELPFKVLRYSSGEEFNGWQVPKNWRVKKALLYRDGALVFDGLSHTLGVALYSRSFSGSLDWNELRAHLVTNKDNPEAYMFHCLWPYRPWAADWALCVPYSLFSTFGPGRYTVELVTEYVDGEMLVGEFEHIGRSPKTIVFNAHNCHPHQANDAFAAVAVLIRLFQWLRTQDTFYSYRLIIAPEHLGTVFYLRDRPVEDLERLVSGIFPEMMGTQGEICATSTFLGGQLLDRALANVLKYHSKAHRIVSWRAGAGNDETVWEAPGYEVPFAEITRTESPLCHYREYHSSRDNLDLMDSAQLGEIFTVLQKVIEVFECDSVMHRNFEGLICLSNPKYDLYFERFDPTIDKKLDDDAEKWGHLLDYLLRYFDGKTTVLDISEKHDLPFDRLYRYLRRYEEKGLIQFEFKPIERLPISRARSPASRQGPGANRLVARESRLHST